MIHTGPIAGIATHGDMVATAGYDNKVILWNHKTRKAIARGMHDHLVNHCAFSADGQWLVSASSDYSVRLWSIPQMRLHAVLSGHEDDVDMAVFSPDDQWIATCALDRKVRVFDLSGQCVLTLKGHTGNVLALAWSGDGQFLVSTSVDGTIRTWDTRTGLQTHQANLHIRTDSLDIAPNGSIYAGDDAGRIVIIHGDKTRFVQAHRAGIKKVALNAEKGTLVCLSYDRSMSVWDISQEGLALEVMRTEMPETIWARAATVLQDGRIATGTFGASYAVFDVQACRWDTQQVVPGNALNDVIQVGRDVFTVGDAGLVFKNGQVFSELGSLCNFLVATPNTLLAGGQMGMLFNAETAQVIHTHHSPLNCAAALESQGSNFMVVGTYTGELLVFEDKGHGEFVLIKEIKVYENAVKGLSHQNGILFSVCASSDIAWHQTSDWTLVKGIEHAHDKITNDCCALDGDQFASVSRDRTLRIWSKHGTAIYPTPHPHSVKCISVSDDHSQLLTGCYGGTLAMFDLNKRQWSKVERPTMSGISAITWNPTAQHFIAASYDGQTYAMALPS